MPFCVPLRVNIDWTKSRKDVEREKNPTAKRFTVGHAKAKVRNAFASVFSKYDQVDETEYFVLQRRKRVSRNKPGHRIILRMKPLYVVAVAFTEHEISTIWRYCRDDLPALFPKAKHAKTLHLWMISHFTKLAIEVRELKNESLNKVPSLRGLGEGKGSLSKHWSSAARPPGPPPSRQASAKPSSTIAGTHRSLIGPPRGAGFGPHASRPPVVFSVRGFDTFAIVLSVVVFGILQIREAGIRVLVSGIGLLIALMYYVCVAKRLSFRPQLRLSFSAANAVAVPRRRYLRPLPPATGSRAVVAEKQPLDYQVTQMQTPKSDRGDAKSAWVAAPKIEVTIVKPPRGRGDEGDLVFLDILVEGVSVRSR